MTDEEFEKLRKTIKRVYKQYIGERTDGDATIVDIAKYFNIPIDKERIDDYTITRFDYSIPSIELIDTKNEIVYNASYTEDAKLLNYIGSQISFNNLISTSPIRKVESLYYIGEKTPIITKMTFKDNDYELTFEKEMPQDVSFFSNDNARFNVRYLKNIIYDGRNEKDLLLTRSFENNYNYKGKLEGSLEQLATYGKYYNIKRNDKQDKYTYIRNNNVTYGINEFEQKGVCYRLQGICFESIKVPVSEYFPLGMYVDNYPMLNDNKTNSAMLFGGLTGDVIDHSLEIYKSDSITKIKYYAQESTYSKGSNGYRNIQRKTLDNGTIAIPVLNKGNITSEEIRNIIDALQIRYGNNDFIKIILKDLETFGKKIDIKNGIVQEELDILSPKLLINKDFEEICNLVSSNKEEYFDLISKQFYNATNIAMANEEEKSKVLKLNDSKK